MLHRHAMLYLDVCFHPRGWRHVKHAGIRVVVVQIAVFHVDGGSRKTLMARWTIKRCCCGGWLQKRVVASRNVSDMYWRKLRMIQRKQARGDKYCFFLSGPPKTWGTTQSMLLHNLHHFPSPGSSVCVYVWDSYDPTTNPYNSHRYHLHPTYVEKVPAHHHHHHHHHHRPAVLATLPAHQASLSQPLAHLGEVVPWKALPQVVGWH